MTAGAHLVGDADLAEGGLLQRQLDDERLDLRRRAVGQKRLLAGEFLQGEFAAGVVELLEAVETVARVAQHLAGLAHVAELLGQLQQAELGADDLLLLYHDRCPLERRGRALRTRASGALLMSRVRITPRVERALRALPGSIIVATVLPIAVQSGSAAVLGLFASLTVMSGLRNEPATEKHTTRAS